MPTDAAQAAAKILRDGSLFQWYVIPLFALVVYVYAVEIEKRNWDLVLAGLAYWGMDWFNEIWNGLVFHFTQHAPVWGAPGKTAYLILIGLNIEILGLPNRLFFAVAGSVFTVCVEIWLNSIGALTWDYPWWNLGAPWLIFLIGYLPFFLVSFWVYDMARVKRKLAVVGTIYGVDVVALILFAVILKWI
jgi:hypothetical protein